MHARLVWAPSLDQERAVSETHNLEAKRQQMCCMTKEYCTIQAKSNSSSKKQQFKLKAVDRVVSHCDCHEETTHQQLSHGKPKMHRVFGTNGNIQSGQLATTVYRPAYMDQSSTNYNEIHAVHAQIVPYTIHACDIRVHA